ncbi:MAG: ABC transporter substrate-binding protein [Bacteroidales bacterium]|nr:ABC transporter substrate-binding protein [Bacteroidales bacterium]
MKCNFFFLKKNIQRFAWLVFSVQLFLLSCSGGDHRHLGKMIFRYNEPAGIASLDPAFARDLPHIWVCNQLYNGLVKLNDSLLVEPAIAKSWTISDDGLTYRFVLRDDVYFHNDPVFNKQTRRVSAHDFVFSFNRLRNPATASPGAWVFANVDTSQSAFRALNDTLLEIKLQKPFPPFLGILSMKYCSVLPFEAVEFYGNDFRKHPVGTGPFYLKKWEENIKMVLRRNDDYFETENGKRLPYLDAVSISFLIDKMTAFLEFAKGDLDLLSGIDPAYKDELLNRQGDLQEKYQSRFEMISLPYLNTEYFGILVDTSLKEVKESPLHLRAVRQAINYGFDRNKMIRYLRNGIGTPGTKGMIPEGMPAFAPDAAYGYEFNPQKSRELLASAGYSTSQPVPPVTLVTTSDYLDLCKFVQSQLQEVGFVIEIQVSPPAAVREMKAMSKLSFFRASWIADYPDEENYLSLFYSKNFAPNGPNYTHFSNGVFDSLYRAAFLETNLIKRSRLYRQMDSLVMYEAPVAVLYYDRVSRFIQKNVKGMTGNAVNSLNLERVWKEE